jgi:hypothetical protein
VPSAALDRLNQQFAFVYRVCCGHFREHVEASLQRLDRVCNVEWQRRRHHEEIQIVGEDITKRGGATRHAMLAADALQALGVAHRGYVLQTGKVILSDTAKGLSANEDVRRAYLGEI